MKILIELTNTWIKMCVKRTKRNETNSKRLVMHSSTLIFEHEGSYSDPIHFDKRSEKAAKTRTKKKRNHHIEKKFRGMVQLTDLVPLIQTITTMSSRTATIYMNTFT